MEPRPTPPTSPLTRPLGPRPGATPLAGGPRPNAGHGGPVTPRRTGPVYRGLPTPIQIAAWVVLAVAVGVIVGSTAPTGLRRIGAVAVLQPSMLAWYSVRALGFLAYLVLAASVLYGLLLSTKILDAIAHRPVSFALHKDLAIVALILAGLHGAILLLDSSFPFTARSILVPFASPYSPVTVGIGQLTFYASAVVTASFYVRRHIGQKAWRLLHYITFLTFAGASFHGIASGSDSGAAWAFWIYLVPVTGSVFLLTYRIVVGLAHRTNRSRVEPSDTGKTQLLRPRGTLDRPGATPGDSPWPS
jgi:predicted ferric reductase